jgi:hypothetical protein
MSPRKENPTEKRRLYRTRLKPVKGPERLEDLQLRLVFPDQPGNTQYSILEDRRYRKN